MAGKTSVSHSIFAVGVDDMKRLAFDLKAAAPEAAKMSSRRMREAAEIVAADARDRVSYSKQIKVKTSVTAVFRAAVVATGRPAAPIENGGKGFVRHPVFGNYDNWTSKGSHPAYLAPALDSNIEEIASVVGAVIDDAMRAVGFR
jgi:hypothetical protein